MPAQRIWLISTLLSLTVAATPAAWAAGLAAAGAGAAVVLGQPLDFSVQLRLDADEPLEPACVAAEVMVGDRKLPANLVRTRAQMIGPQWARVQVATTLAIEEPVLSVDLSVGCTSRITRQYVLLADPPQDAPAPQAALALAVPDAAGQVPQQALRPARVGARSGQRPSNLRAARRAGSAGRPVLLAALAPLDEGSATRPASRASRPTRPAAAASSVSRSASRVGLRKALPAAGTKAPPPSRLQLDLMAPASPAGAEAVEQALQAVALAASSARAAAAAASAAALRISSLEATVEQLRADDKAQAEAMAVWRERVARAEASGRQALALMWAAGALGLLAAWLAWRVNGLQRERRRGWRQAAARADAPRGHADAPPAAIAPPVAARPPATPSPAAPKPGAATAAPPASADLLAPKPRPAPAWPPAAAVDDERVAPSTSPAMTRVKAFPATQTLDAARHARPAVAGAGAPRFAPLADELPASQRTEVLFPAGASPTAAPRDVAIEELIDLEQQADFFSVLGRDEAAVDLLVEHLRSTGGGSPLPYLKLLEIHHRRGDRAAYERMRSRFNERFNGVAPAWGDDLHGGCALEDYPGVLPRLQQVWARPLDAMAELEALLFRKSRGELFELPAYREVLFLYSLARDLLDHETADSDSVDLLLPLSGSEPQASLRSLLQGLDEGEPSDFGGRPTAPLDFDLAAAERGDSLFDGLGDQPERRRR